MAELTLGTFLKVLRDTIDARPALAGVTVQIVSPDETMRERVTLLRGDELRRLSDWSTIGDRRYEESVTLPARVVAYESGNKADANVIAAIDRADSFITEIFEVVADMMSTNTPAFADQTTEAIVGDRSYRVVIPDRGGWLAIVDFDITITGRASRS